MLASAKPMSKRERRAIRKENAGLQMHRIKPLTENQGKAFEAWHQGQDLMLFGTFGTGKTMLGMYFGLKEVLSQNAQKVIIIRSTVPSRDMGFLPGTAKDKVRAYELPYIGICNELFNRGDAYDILKQKEMIEFIPTSFIRGTTIDNAIVLVDECQNMNWSELHGIMSRAGENARFVFMGDYKQTDLKRHEGRDDILKMTKVIDRMDCFGKIEMNKDDVVRSGKGKQYALALDECGF